MRRIVAILCTSMVLTSIGFSTPITASETVATPPQAVTVVPQGDVVHVFCNRTDANFDDVQDAGDSPAAWLIVDAKTKMVLSSMNFPWANVVASRPALLKDDLYVLVNDSVHNYSVSNMSLKRTKFVGTCAALSLTMDGNYLVTSYRPNFVDPGKLRGYATSDLSRTSEFAAGINVQQTLEINFNDTFFSYTLNEGSFGSEDGTLQMTRSDAPDGNDTVIATGGLLNHMCPSSDSSHVYVTMTGTHEVAEIDVALGVVSRRIPTLTTGYDGPRECLVHDNRLFVSTFSGDVRIFDIADGALVGKISLSAKPEGIAIVNNELWVTRSFELDGYGAEINIEIYPLNSTTSISASNSSTQNRSGILVTNNVISVPEFSGNSNVHAVSSLGKSYSLSIDSSGLIDLKGLIPGVYVLQSQKKNLTLSYQPIH
ncbi:MAG: hypothetical protein HQ472_03570 [Ignavibacteria bacterium]|nr:hypothetical protein [Ignavibacteria bacterium]